YQEYSSRRSAEGPSHASSPLFDDLHSYGCTGHLCSHPCGRHRSNTHVGYLLRRHAHHWVSDTLNAEWFPAPILIQSPFFETALNFARMWRRTSYNEAWTREPTHSRSR